MALIIHADDFGITVEQSKAILELSDACGGHGALSSMSMFANSPAFNELVRPFVDAGKIKLGLHLNIVEGHPVSNPDDVPLLVNERGTFSHSFMGYLMASTLRTSDRDGIREQLARDVSPELAFVEFQFLLRVFYVHALTSFHRLISILLLVYHSRN